MQPLSDAPRRARSRSVYVFSVRRGDRALLHAASGANASEVSRCRAAQADRCREWCAPKAWPTSWDAYLLRPLGPLPPPEATPLAFPMNVINAENFALRALRALGHAHAARSTARRL